MGQGATNEDWRRKGEGEASSPAADDGRREISAYSPEAMSDDSPLQLLASFFVSSFSTLVVFGLYFFQLLKLLEIVHSARA